MNKIIHGIEVDNENYIELFTMFLQNSKENSEMYKKELDLLKYCCKIVISKSGKIEESNCNIYKVLGPNPKASDIRIIKEIFELVFKDEKYNKEAYENSFLTDKFKYGFAIMPGYNLSLPTSNDELVNLIITYGKIINSDDLNPKIKIKYEDIMRCINSKIAKFAENTYLLYDQAELVMKNMQTMLNSIRKTKEISFIDEEFFYQLLDHHMTVTLMDKDGKVFEVTECPSSTFVKDYKEDYEKELVEFNKQREIQKYFKKVNKKTLNNISFNDFPSYDNPNFLDYMYKILDLLEEANNPEIYAIASLKIIHYYQDDSISKDNIKSLNN